MSESTSILGNRVLRKEDPKFLTTGGVYVDDVRVDLVGAAAVTYVRATMAHARITGIDTSEAEGMPGVVTVRTKDNLELAGVQGFVMLDAIFEQATILRTGPDGLTRIIAVIRGVSGSVSRSSWMRAGPSSSCSGDGRSSTARRWASCRPGIV